MSEEKSNSSRIQILLAVIASLTAITVALIGKCDFSVPDKTPTETTSQPTQKTDDAETIASKPNPASESKPPVVPLKSLPEALIGTKLQFRGQVVDENGRGVSGVEITCTDCTPPGQTTRTDKHGNFTLPHPIERKHDIHQIHLSLSKAGRSANYYAAVGETAMLAFPSQ